MSVPPPLTAARFLAYGAPILGLAFMLFFVQFYFLKFATDILLLPPAWVGALFALAKVWDAASNPLVGSWSDRTKSRWGRRRPFLFGALPLLVAGYVMLWRPPHALGQVGLFIWVGVALFIFFSAFALYAIPHAALGAEMSPDSHERTRLFGGKQISFTLGILVAFAAIQAAMNAEVPRTAAGNMALPSALGAIVLLAITPLVIADLKGGASGGQGLRGGMRDVLANRPARRLLFVWFVESLGVGAVGTMAPYIAEYLLERPDIVGTLPAAYVVAGVASIPLWVRVSRRYGPRDTWLGTMLLASAAFGGMMFVGSGDLPLAFVLLIAAGIAMGCGSVLSASLMADLIDLDEKNTGERKEGVYSASMMFALKIGASLATAATGVVLGIAGFVPNTAQTPESLLGMRILFGGFPCAGFLIGAILFRGFPLGLRPKVAEVSGVTVEERPAT